MTYLEKEIGYAVTGCLNNWREVGEITREMLRDITAIFCSRKNVDAKKVVKFVESNVVHTI